MIHTDSKQINNNNEHKEMNDKVSYLADRLELLFAEMNKAYVRLIELEQWRFHQEDDLK
jgi:hypothetical protein